MQSHLLRETDEREVERLFLDLKQGKKVRRCSPVVTGLFLLAGIWGCAVFLFGLIDGFARLFR